MGLEQFKTKKDKLAYVKKIIYDHGCGYIKPGDEHYNIFLELVKDKYTNVDYFSIVPNRRNYTSLETQAHLKDGTIDVFSWNKRALGRVDTEHKKLRNILRESIVSDILAFKKDAICCAICSRTEYLHADHINPFRDIVSDYISEYGKETNPEWISRWITYHKEHAQLQILCASCNYKKH